MFILAIRCSVRRLISRFSSSDCSDRSSMCELKSGSPCLAKYSSPAAITPSTQGSSFFAQ